MSNQEKAERCRCRHVVESWRVADPQSGVEAQHYVQECSLDAGHDGEHAWGPKVEMHYGNATVHNVKL